MRKRDRGYGLDSILVLPKQTGYPILIHITIHPLSTDGAIVIWVHVLNADMYEHIYDNTYLIVFQNVEVLKDADAVKQLGNILKTNVRACKALGHPYVLQVLLY